MLELDQLTLSLKNETSTPGYILMLCCLVTDAFLLYSNTGFQFLGASIIRWLHELRTENIAKRILALLLKLAAVFRCIPFQLLRRKNTITPSRATEDELNPTHAETTMKDKIRPCLERIQELEKVYEEIRNKPVEIPVEKERMLMDSLDRIKSVEFDLVKTKGVIIYASALFLTNST